MSKNPTVHKKEGNEISKTEQQQIESLKDYSSVI